MGRRSFITNSCVTMPFIAWVRIPGPHLAVPCFSAPHVQQVVRGTLHPGRVVPSPLRPDVQAGEEDALDRTAGGAGAGVPAGVAEVLVSTLCSHHLHHQADASMRTGSWASLRSLCDPVPITSYLPPQFSHL